MLGIHWYDAIFIVTNIIPILIGLFWLWPDANRRGQPGWLWALLTIPFGWITIIVYAIIRSFTPVRA